MLVNKSFTLTEHRKKYPGVLSAQSCIDYRDNFCKWTKHIDWIEKMIKWREDYLANHGSSSDGR